ncbi:hypothetical protein JW992_05565 [candidate division KSB1 bacterium]|nr:hypothetical protein [candidate division KSB1 bacterium]
MKFIASIFLLLGLGSTTFLQATPVVYGGGPLQVVPAWNLPKGQMILGTHSRAFFTSRVREEANGRRTGITYWDIQGGLGLTYAFTSKLQFGLNPIVYQDNHVNGDGYNLPDDLYLSAKLGSIGRPAGTLRVGAQLDIRFPIADEHNLPLEPYSAGRIGVGIRGLFSILSEPLYPEDGTNIHLNLGFFNHNDLGVRILETAFDTVQVTSGTREIRYGAAFSAPINDFIVFTELFGTTFLKKPPEQAFGRESSLYFSPGISYAANPWLRLRVSFDLRLLGGTDETVFNSLNTVYTKDPWSSVPNYPTWRINVGAVIALRPGLQLITAEDRAERAKQKEEELPADATIYDQLAKERQETEGAEAELERIRRERQRMEDLLERLRTILETPSEPPPSTPPRQ